MTGLPPLFAIEKSMEQQELRQWENRCVQEETPQCVAACPLHVDAKAVCKLMGQGRWDKAWQVLAKTLPLPSVLARLCESPCQHACRREGAGGAIEMGALERFCAEKAQSVPPPKPLPTRGKKIAVIGGNLTGLCATWELARRGFTPFLFCTELGADVPQELSGHLENEIDSLRTLGVTLDQNQEDLLALSQSILGEYDAIFLDMSTTPQFIEEYGEPDYLTLGTIEPGIFAGKPNDGAAIDCAAIGRRAANSIERFTQGVSMVTGRELEGPYTTRLYTNLSTVTSESPIKALATESDARDEAKRCLQCECMECVNHCEFLKKYKFYPKVYVRQIYNNESIVMGTRQANKMINSCMLCGLCETLCPEDFSMADVCLEARKTLVENENMPPSAHEFALRDMAFANSDQSSLIQHAPGSEKSRYLYFPGCQLTASAPKMVMAAYEDLQKHLDDVGLMLRCCSAPALWAGRQSLLEAALETLRSEWEHIGKPVMIVACPTCKKTLRAHLPEAEILTHWSVLRSLGVEECSPSLDQTLALKDPCSARHDGVLREDVRLVLEQRGVQFLEPEMSGEYAECCGYGGLLSEVDPDLGLAVASRQGRAVQEDFVTYCIMCRDMLAKSGKRALHLYDLLYATQEARAERPAPGYSERRENRIRLKESLLTKLWGKTHNRVVAAHETIEVMVSSDVDKILNERRILISDIQKVLLHFQQSGESFHHAENGHSLAFFRPTVVTYWVEFEEKDEGFLIYNAWCHRMHIAGVAQ